MAAKESMARREGQDPELEVVTTFYAYLGSEGQ